MGKYRLILVLILAVTSPAAANSILTLADEIRIPLPGGWQLTTGVNEYPIQIFQSDSAAELLIFKSTIDEADAVTNEQELKVSVDKVIEDVILSLPEARLQTNIGYYDTSRVWFVLEFLSLDPDEELELRHRLRGELYRHPEGHQILFTLWGKGARDVPRPIWNDVRLMQEEFVYFGAATRDVFATPNRQNWAWAAVLLMLLAIVLLLLKRRRQAARNRKTPDDHFWRCQCGRLNHRDHQNCRRCGRSLSTPVTT
ncbi:MAG: hypothetical protein JSW34_13380 [Candidatus Zixiibacteriota bacterium]|nr:MAG: hypothetical protein JSW34_13380 [candidate division Zixibacteria bacterium]